MSENNARLHRLPRRGATNTPFVSLASINANFWGKAPDRFKGGSFPAARKRGVAGGRGWKRKYGTKPFAVASDFLQKSAMRNSSLPSSSSRTKENNKAKKINMAIGRGLMNRNSNIQGREGRVRGRKKTSLVSSSQSKPTRRARSKSLAGTSSSSASSNSSSSCSSGFRTFIKNTKKERTYRRSLTPAVQIFCGRAGPPRGASITEERATAPPQAQDNTTQQAQCNDIDDTKNECDSGGSYVNVSGIDMEEVAAALLNSSVPVVATSVARTSADAEAEEPTLETSESEVNDKTGSDCSRVGDVFAMNVSSIRVEREELILSSSQGVNEEEEEEITQSRGPPGSSSVLMSVSQEVGEEEEEEEEESRPKEVAKCDQQDEQCAVAISSMSSMSSLSGSESMKVSREEMSEDREASDTSEVDLPADREENNERESSSSVSALNNAQLLSCMEEEKELHARYVDREENDNSAVTDLAEMASILNEASQMAAHSAQALSQMDEEMQIACSSLSSCDSITKSDASADMKLDGDKDGKEDSGGRMWIHVHRFRAMLD